MFNSFYTRQFCFAVPATGVFLVSLQLCLLVWFLCLRFGVPIAVDVCPFVCKIPECLLLSTPETRVQWDLCNVDTTRPPKVS